MVRVGAICGECGKYHQGDCCPVCHINEPKESLNIIQDFHEEYFDVGLGEVVKSRQHRKQLMKAKGLEEVGNERKYVDPVRRRNEQTRMINKAMESVNKDAYQYLGRMGWN